MVNGVMTIERMISIRLMFKVLGPHTTTVMGEALLMSLGVRTAWLYRESSITSEGEGDSERHPWLKRPLLSYGDEMNRFLLAHFCRETAKEANTGGGLTQFHVFIKRTRGRAKYCTTAEVRPR